MFYYVLDNESVALLPSWIFTAGAIIGIAVSLLFYALRSVGLFALAKKNNVANAFVAWIPFAWIYLAAKLCGSVTFFGKSFKNFAIVILVVFSVTQVLTVAFYALSYIPIAGYYLQGGTIYYNQSVTNNGLIGISYPLVGYVYTEIPVNVGYVYSPSFINIFGIFSIFLRVFDLANIVLLVTMYFALFNKFWPAHSLIATVFSAFGLFGPFAFAVRNKKSISREEYFRRRYGYYQNPYGNPYANPNPTEKPPETPFAEFAEKGEVDPGDPFSEFSDDNKNGKGGDR